MSNSSDAPVVRFDLLTAVLEGAKPVHRVEVKRIEMTPNTPSGLHLHPCPVIGVITAGSVYFEVKGEPPRVLNPGDAFFEPANAHVPHFDAQEKGATFIAHYLLGEGEHELLKMID